MNKHGLGADAVVDAAIAGAACAESGMGVTAHTFVGPAQFGFRAGLRDADDEDGGAPVS
jgi:hypothetical protein